MACGLDGEGEEVAVVGGGGGGEGGKSSRQLWGGSGEQVSTGGERQRARREGGGQERRSRRRRREQTEQRKADTRRKNRGEVSAGGEREGWAWRREQQNTGREWEGGGCRRGWRRRQTKRRELQKADRMEGKGELSARGEGAGRLWQREKQTVGRARRLPSQVAAAADRAERAADSYGDQRKG